MPRRWVVVFDTANSTDWLEDALLRGDEPRAKDKLASFVGHAVDRLAARGLKGEGRGDGAFFIAPENTMIAEALIVSMKLIRDTATLAWKDSRCGMERLDLRIIGALLEGGDDVTRGARFFRLMKSEKSICPPDVLAITGEVFDQLKDPAVKSAFRPNETARGWVHWDVDHRKELVGYIVGCGVWCAHAECHRRWRTPDGEPLGLAEHARVVYLDPLRPLGTRFRADNVVIVCEQHLAEGWAAPDALRRSAEAKERYSRDYDFDLGDPE